MWNVRHTWCERPCGLVHCSPLYISQPANLAWICRWIYWLSAGVCKHCDPFRKARQFFNCHTGCCAELTHHGWQRRPANCRRHLRRKLIQLATRFTLRLMRIVRNQLPRKMHQQTRILCYLKEPCTRRSALALSTFSF